MQLGTRLLDTLDSSSYKPLFFIIGFASIFTQSVLLREVLSVLYGNELLIGVGLGLWMALIALGSYSAKKIELPIDWTLLVYPFLSLLSLVLVRLTRTLFGIIFGQAISFLITCFVLFLTFFPSCFFLGYLFSRATQEYEEEAGKYYAWESLGFLLGGIFFSFLFAHLPSLYPVFFVIFLCLIYFISKKKKYWPLVLILPLLFFSIPRIGTYTMKKAYKDYNLIDFWNSPYGRVVLVRGENQTSFFKDGTYLFSNKQGPSKEDVHLPLLAVEDPNQVLLVGDLSLAGEIPEKVNLDYSNLDRRLFQAGKRYLELKEVNYKETDPRNWVSGSKNKYDSIITAVGKPLTIETNRYYTVQFYKEAKEALKEKGVLAIRAPLKSYFGEGTKRLNSLIYSDLIRTFKNVTIIKSDSNTWFLASDHPIRKSKLLERFKSREMETEFLTAQTLRYFLGKSHRQIQGVEEENLDLNPKAYIFSLISWASRNRLDSLKNYLKTVPKLGFLPLLALIFIFMIFYKGKNSSLMFLTSFIATLAEILLMVVFQSKFGVLYKDMSIFYGCFMLGTSLGSFLSTIKKKKILVKGLMFSLPLLPFLSFELGFFSRLWLLTLNTFAGLIIGYQFGLLAEGETEKIYAADMLGGGIASFLSTLLFIPAIGLTKTPLVLLEIAVLAIVLEMV